MKFLIVTYLEMKLAKMGYIEEQSLLRFLKWSKRPERGIKRKPLIKFLFVMFTQKIKIIS